jgi:hypothetical protein
MRNSDVLPSFFQLFIGSRAIHPTETIAFHVQLPVQSRLDEPILAVCNQILIERTDEDFIEKAAQTGRPILSRSFSAARIGTTDIVRVEHNFVLLLSRRALPYCGNQNIAVIDKTTTREAGRSEVASAEPLVCFKNCKEIPGPVCRKASVALVRWSVSRI